jgi:putative peptidoglycan lipid II flippase
MMPEIIWYTAPGFRQNPEVLKMTILFARITFPYLFCISLAAFYGGVLNSFNRFLPFALAPTILNISTIIALIFFDYLPTTGHTLSVATTVSGIIELLWMVFFLLKYNCKLSWQKNYITPQTKQIFKKMLPVIFSAGITHLNIWISIIILSFFSGGITYIYYAERIVQLPLALIGTAIGTVLLPALSKSFAQDSAAKTIAMQNKAINLALFLALPASLALFFMADEIIFLLFERDNFTRLDTDNTANALQILSAGLPAFVMVKLFQTKFYANLNTKIPMIISVSCMVINVLISIATMQTLQFKGVALANAVSGWLNFLSLLTFAHIKIGFKFHYETLLQIIKSISASVLMILAIYLWRDYIFFFDQHLLIISEIIIGLFTYLAACYIFRIRLTR